MSWTIQIRCSSSVDLDTLQKALKSCKEVVPTFLNGLNDKEITMNGSFTSSGGRALAAARELCTWLRSHRNVNCTIESKDFNPRTIAQLNCILAL